MIEDRLVGGSDPHSGTGPRDACGRWAAGLSVAAGCAALIGAWYRPVWHDELYTLYLARLPLAEMLEALRSDSGPPLHYLICKLLFTVFGWQEGAVVGTFAVRLPSVAAFAVMPWLLRRVRAPGCGAFPWASLLAVSWLPLFYFGTEARAYALLALANTLVWVRGAEWLAGGGFRVFCLAATTAALPLLHYTGYLSLAAVPLLAFFVPRRRRRALWLALGVASLPALAWLPVVFQAPDASMAWVETATGPGRPGLSTVQVLAPAGPFPDLFEVFRTPVPEWFSLGVVSVLGAAAAVGAGLMLRKADRHARELKTAAGMMVGLTPVALVAVLALAGAPVYFAGRSESQGWALLSAGAVVLLAGLPVVVRWIAAGSYALVGLMTIVLWLGDLPSRAPAPGVEVGMELAPVVETGDRVLVAGLWQLEVRHGLAVGSPGGKVPTPVETIPRSQAGHPGWLDIKALRSPDLLAEARALEREARLSGQRVWLIRSPSLLPEQIVNPVFRGWRRMHIGRSPIIVVDLFVRPTPLR